MAAGLLFGGAAPARAQCAGCPNPSFGPAGRSFPLPAGRFFPVSGDFNGDGSPDIAVAGNDGVTIFLGNGAGSFSISVNRTVPGHPNSVAAGDVDGDGKADLVVALGGDFEYFTDPGGIVILYGDGAGGILSERVVPAPVWPYLPVIADINGDGKADVVVGSSRNANFNILTGDGSGGLGPPAPFPGGWQSPVLIADVNGDGVPDIVTADGNIGLGNSSHLLVSLGSGGGAFGPAREISIDPVTYGVRTLFAADLNRDGRLDVVASDGYSTAVLLGAGGGDLAPPYSLSSFTAVGVGDFDQDGNPDLLNGSAVFLGDGFGGFTSAGPRVRLALSGPFERILVVDLDGDGKDDLVASGSGYLDVVRGIGEGRFETAREFPMRIEHGPFLAAGDFNADQKTDIVSASLNQGFLVRLNNGDGTFGPELVTLGTYYSTGIVPGDFNNDGKLDVAVSEASYPSAQILLFRGDGAGHFVSAVSTPLSGAQIQSLVAGDFNRDLKGDLAVVLDGRVLILLGDGLGAFSLQQTLGAAWATTAIAVADINGDTIPDVVAAQSGNLQPYLGDGSGSFVAGNPRMISIYPSTLLLRDVNGDVRPDALTFNDFGEVFVAPGDGAGGFGPVTMFQTASGASALAVDDFLADGGTEIAVFGYARVDLFRFVPATGFVSLGTFVVPGRGGLAADISGDGKPDLVGYTYDSPTTLWYLENTNCRPRRIELERNLAACGNAGSPLPVQPIARVTDDGDNLISCDEGTVTASVVPGSGTPGAHLSGVTAVPVASGLAAFTNLAIDLPGKDYRLRFSHPAAGPGASRPFSLSLPPPVIGMPADLCAGGARRFEAPEGYDTYLWTLDGSIAGRSREVVISGLASGEHTIRLSVTRHGCAASSSVTFNLAASPAAPAAGSNSPVAFAATLQLTSSNIPNATYSWTGPNGFRSDVKNPVISNVTRAASGVYSVVARVGGCASTASSTAVTVLPVPACAGCGNPSFAGAARKYPADRAPGMILVRDFDRDGSLDVLVASRGGSAVTLYPGDGRGGFGAPIDSPVSGYIQSLAAVDMNRDGLLDLAFTSSTYSVVFVARGLGAGRFGNVLSYAAGSSPGDLVAGDFNEDGWPDLAILNGSGPSASILLGNGSGGLLAAVQYPVGPSPFALVTGDFNGDHHLDIAVAASLNSSLSILTGDGKGVFVRGSDIAVSPSGGTFIAGSLASGDFNGDGIPDLAVAGAFGPLNGVALLKGRGDGTFLFIRVFPITVPQYQPPPEKIRVADFDGDGHDDISVVAIEFTVLPGRGEFDFGAPLSFPAGFYPVAYDFGDLDHDGFVDVVLGDFSSKATFTVLRGAPQGLFAAPPRFSIEGSPTAMVACDFDLNGTPDLAVADSSEGDIQVFFNDGLGRFRAGPVLQGVQGQLAMVCGDFNGDGRPDLAATGYFLLGSAVFFGDGAGGFRSVSGSLPASSVYWLVGGDFNGDGKTDLVVGAYGGPAYVALSDGSGRFTTSASWADTSYSFAAVGDFNRDGKLDLALSAYPDALSILLGNGNGTFSAPVKFPLAEPPGLLVTGDFNGDSRLDIAVAGQFIPGFSRNLTIFLGDGFGGFTSPGSVGPPGSISGAAVGDWNGDGKVDIALTRGDPTDLLILLGDGMGGFSVSTSYTVGDGGSLPLSADFDGDGRPDLAVVDAYAEEVDILLNTNCVPTRLQITASPSCAAPSQAFPTQPVVRVVDDGDNVVQCDARDVRVSVKPGTGTPNAVLGGTTSRLLQAGVAAFTNLSIDLPGTGYVLQFDSPAVASVLSPPLAVHDPYAVSIAAPSLVCAGRPAVFSADPGFDVYYWSIDGTFSAVGRTVSFAGVSAGPHTYSVAAYKDGCVASTSTQVVVTSTPAPPAVSNNGPLCPGSTLQLTAQSVEGATYRWTGPNGFVSTDQNPQLASVTTAMRGAYSVTITVGACVSDPASTFAVVYFPPSTTITSTASVCPDRRGNVASVPSAGVGAAYSWSVTNGVITAGAGTNSITFTSGSSGSVGLSVVVTPGTGCAPQSGSLNLPIASCGVEPVGLTVDPAPYGSYSDGNGILEPNEAVVVRPSWKNLGSAELALRGTASRFTGPPAGGSYYLYDPSADYGSLAPGGANDCATATGNCYELSLSSYIRPATHWDATFTETLSEGDPPTTWKLHIGESFTDVPKAHVFYPYVERLLHNGVTTGCGAGTYCPEDFVSRLQMAIFIARAQAGGDGNVPSSGTAQGQAFDCKVGGSSLFSDIATDDPFCRHVHYIYGTGVTMGCEPGKYCPDPSVTRAQIAMFIARAMAGSDAAVPQTYGPDPATGRSYSCDAGSPNLHFTDVTTSDIFCRHTHYLWAKDVISGFPDNSYQPGLTVTRGAMAKFLSNGFNLRLYGP